MPEFQPQQRFFEQNVEPDQTTDSIILSGGQSAPYYFFLGVNSTVPFVKLEGSAASAKEFSWGEVIEVQPGTTLKVRNSSRHKGDIHIQSGNFPPDAPQRISVPVTFTAGEASGPQQIFFQAGYIDTRRAKRAYLSMDPLICENDDGIFAAFAFYSDHAANVDGYDVNAIIVDQPPAAWRTDLELLQFIEYKTVPLGQNADLPDTTTLHNLPDFMRIVMVLDNAAVIRRSFIILEY